LRFAVMEFSRFEVSCFASECRIALSLTYRR
jgi:hypothetical protein